MEATTCISNHMFTDPFGHEVTITGRCYYIPGVGVVRDLPEGVQVKDPWYPVPFIRALHETVDVNTGLDIKIGDEVLFIKDRGYAKP